MDELSGAIRFYAYLGYQGTGSVDLAGPWNVKTEVLSAEQIAPRLM